MARFDLHRCRGSRDYLLDIQHDALDQLPTRIVVPVLPLEAAPPPRRDLNPQVEIEGEMHAVLPQYLASVERRDLGRAVGSLEAHGERITRALRLVHGGF